MRSGEAAERGRVEGQEGSRLEQEPAAGQTALRGPHVVLQELGEHALSRRILARTRQPVLLVTGRVCPAHSVSDDALHTQFLEGRRASLSADPLSKSRIFLKKIFQKSVILEFDFLQNEYLSAGKFQGEKYKFRAEVLLDFGLADLRPCG